MYSRSQNYFVNKTAELDAQVQFDLKAGKLRFFDADQYIRTTISGMAGSIQLIDETTEKKHGVTNFHTNKLPKGVNMAVEALRAGFGKTAVLDGSKNPAEVKYSNGYAAVPAALANADLIISLNDKPVVEIPVQRLLAEDANTKAIGIDDCYELGALQLIKGEEPIKLELRFPKGVSMPTDFNYFFELHLIGSRTGLR